MGYIYILSNEYYYENMSSLERLANLSKDKSKVYKDKSRHYIYKIGFTFDNPNSRAKQLSDDTRILADFKVEYWLKFSNYKLAEKIVHEKLKKYRVRSNREFFKVDLNKAIEIIETVFYCLEERNPEGNEFYNK